MTELKVPFLKPSVGDEEIGEVLDTLRSGWLTSGPKVKRFEEEFARAVGGRYAVAVNSCTAALHLAVEAIGLKPGQGVLVPTMTFAATAEVVRYMGAIPVLVDCDPVTANMSLDDARRKLQSLRDGDLPEALGREMTVVGVIPVHVGGMMMDMRAVNEFASEHGLWVIEDAAHAFPAAWREGPGGAWQRCGEGTSSVTCYSFYANKTITTGEGGMAVTDDAALADRMRLMSLHGLSHDAWGRYTGGGSWDYRIVAPGFKYNLTDIAAAVGIHQLAKAERMRLEREAIALRYIREFREVEELELPHTDVDRIHSWHLFPIRLKLENLQVSRNQFIEGLKAAGVGCSVHWRPLHLHPYYEESFGWRREDLPAASSLWERVLSLPIFPGMQDWQIEHVVLTVKALCAAHSAQEVLAI
ncbi:MAG: DegT/DnrJ/EryC1/StrS family aminotransferase [Rubrivivax sp.]|nr:DegT/DnrJ/EryC1/StrS family aminotransferase [Pyrinomonadaceae bacterium]